MAMTATTLRLDEADKEEACRILKAMGLSLNGYLTIAVKQLVNQRRVPFEIVAGDAGAPEGGRR